MSSVGIVNFLLYQVGWFACVLGAAFGRPWLGSAIALLLVAVHVFLTTQRLTQVKLMLAALLIGLVVDSTLLQAGVFTFPYGMVVAWLPPIWMSVLWIQFATTFRYCLAWLSGKCLLCAFLGLVGAPMAFLGGERLDAISFLAPRLIHIFLLGSAWCLAIPLLIHTSDRIHEGSVAVASYRGLKPPS